MKELFLHPSNEYRAKPFWAWNGHLREEELKRQMNALKDMGFGGTFMHSRVGLETEYLGDEWFRLINACADYGKELGLENWIYDEDRWPSGSAGGIVTKDKSLRMKHIRMRTGAPGEDADVIGVFSCRLEKENIYDVQPVTDITQATGDVIWFEIITRPENSNYNGAAYLDTMSRKATEAFLNSTHKKYVQACGERIGTSIQGFFTDEPHRGELLVDVVREGLDFSCIIPYTDDLFDRFQQDWGYDLRSHLPAIFFRENGEKVSQVKWHYCETLQRLFLENHIVPVSQWCKDHGIVYTGHMLHEDSLSAQALMTGSLMRCYEHMEYPGVDLLGNSNVNYNIVKQVSSVAHQCGKKWILSEMYGASGWYMKLEDYKRIGDWQAILGINLRCPHLSWYTMAGECKRDFPASISFQSGWYKEYKYLEDYFARLAVFMSQGTPDRDVLVINSVESMWCSYYSGWAQWLVTKDQACLEIENAYQALAQFLLSNNVEYDYGDEEMLSRLARVEGDSLIVGKVRYKKVIVPKMLTIRSSTLALLERFAAAGGSVVVYAELPRYVDAKPATVAIGNATMAAVLDHRKLMVEDERVLTSLRKTEDGLYYIMALNTDAENAISAPIRLPCGNVQQWDPETGEVTAVETSSKIFLQPGQMLLLCVGGESAEIPAEEALPYLRLQQTFDYTTDDHNVLVIDRVTCCFDGEEWHDDVLKIDRKLRERLQLPVRGGEMFQPWYTAAQTPVSYGEFALTYTFESHIACQALLATEATGEIRVNGHIVSLPEEWWIDPCFKKVPIMLQKGRNVITVRDTFTQQRNLEAIYILGEFGVFDGVIDTKPETIALGDITSQGFPHYSGKIKYIFKQPVLQKSFLQLPNMGGAAAIRVNGKIVAWQPYRVQIDPCEQIEVELSLTRRNTFGPLHQKPAVDVVCSPESFLTTGKNWSNDMVVVPCGLCL